MPYDAPDHGHNAPYNELARIVDRGTVVPSRHVLVATSALRMVLLVLPPGFSTTPHLHPHADEAFQVLAGRIAITIGDDPEFDARPGSVLFAQRGAPHKIQVLGPDDSYLLCTVAPNEDRDDEQIEVPVGWRTTTDARPIES